jgi:hypothetical protein
MFGPGSRIRLRREMTVTGTIRLESGDILMATPWGRPPTNFEQLAAKFPVPGSKDGPALGAGSTAAYRPEVLGRVDRLRVDPLDPFAISTTLRDARREIWRQAEGLTGGRYLVDTATELGVRASRSICGLARVSDDDAWQFRKYVDGIARSSWDIDIWPAESYDAPAVDRESDTDLLRKAKMMAGEYFDIRYGCLVACGVDNLMVAGRCLSAERTAQASLRIQQTCQSTGQAAGMAAAMSIERNVTPRELDPAPLVAGLVKARAAVEPACELLRNLKVMDR